MIEDNQILVFSLLAVVVFVLSTYLGFLYNKLRMQKKYIELKEIEYKEAIEKRESSIKESLFQISRAVINDQCEVSEGCIRITKLKEIIPSLEEIEELKVFNHMFSEIEKFPYLEARDELSKQEKFKQDNERFAIEDKYRDRIKQGCKDLLEAIK